MAPLTLENALHWANSLLKQHGFIEEARLESELLLAHLLQKERVQLYTQNQQPLTLTQWEQYQALLQKRLAYWPVAYLMETREFYGLPFWVTPSVLIPRPETELLVEMALKKYQGQSGRLLDLGTGSGCIALSLLSNLPHFEADLVDISEEALFVAKKNAQQLHLETRIRFFQGDFFGPVAGQRYMFILSNPPYIAESEKATLQREVALYEPHHALFAPEEGLYFLKKIIQQSPEFLTRPGTLWLEMGQHQWKELLPYAKSCGYDQVSIKKDLAGIERILMGEIH